MTIIVRRIAPRCRRWPIQSGPVRSRTYPASGQLLLASVRVLGTQRYPAGRPHPSPTSASAARPAEPTSPASKEEGIASQPDIASSQYSQSAGLMLPFSVLLQSLVLLFSVLLQSLVLLFSVLVQSLVLLLSVLSQTLVLLYSAPLQSLVVLLCAMLPSHAWD